MRRTVELKIEVADDATYADAIAAIYQAVISRGRVQDIKFTRASADLNARIEQVLGFPFKQYSGSVHDDR